MLFDFPQDVRAPLIDDEFMFGRDLLIFPVTEPILYTASSTPVPQPPQSKECYPPSDADWYDFGTNERFSGGQFVKMPLSHIPVFVRAGAELPVCEMLSYAQEEKPVQVRHYPE